VKQLDENAPLKKLDDRKKMQTCNLQIVTIQKDGKDLALLGNPLLLKQTLLGIFSSMKCPARLILTAHDTAKKLSKKETAIISGFQSPIEKEILEVLLRGTGPIIICLARGLEGMRIPVAWREPVAQGRMLLLSPFPGYIKRPTVETAEKRNHFIAELAESILVINASEGGRLEEQVKLWESSGKQIQRLG
jgi:predicted Rossmann fold nucleotide-binding protein DprA/Smf involved in DNA uptake